MNGDGGFWRLGHEDLTAVLAAPDCRRRACMGAKSRYVVRRESR